MGIDDVVSSMLRMRIASLISIRPRTLGELADTTGISVQGVLKHLAKLRKSGFLTETELRDGKHLKYRKVYSIERRRISDFSQGDLMVAHVSREAIGEERKVKSAYEELETLAEDMIIARRRIRDVTKRLERLIEELVSSQGQLMRMTQTIGLSKEEQQIASVFFSEDGIEESNKILSRYYGSEDADEALRNVLQKIKGA